MDNQNNLRDTNTELKFCEYCGSPLFDYGNVCKSCGRKQPMKNNTASATPSPMQNGGYINVGTSAAPTGNMSNTYSAATASGNNSAYIAGNSMQPPASEMPGDTSGQVGIAASHAGTDTSDINFCVQCRGIVDAKSGRCQSCGRVYSSLIELPSAARKTSKEKKKSPVMAICLSLTGALALVLAVVAVVLFMQVSKYKRIAADTSEDSMYYMQSARDTELIIAEKQTEIDEYRQKLEDTEQELEYVNEDLATVTEQRNELQEWKDSNADKVKFMDDHIVIVIEGDSSKYHKIDCPNIPENYSFWAYNSENAISKGYSKCYTCCD